MIHLAALAQYLASSDHLHYVSGAIGDNGDHVRGRVPLTHKLLNCLKGSSTIEHFTDVLFDTPNFDLMRHNCWLVQRQGIHLDQPWAPVHKCNHYTMSDSHWRLNVVNDDIHGHLYWTKIIGESDIVKLFKTVQLADGQPLVANDAATLATSFERVWASVETARARRGNLTFDISGWKNCAVLDGIPKKGIVATCTYDGHDGIKELLQAGGSLVPQAPSRTKVMLARWRPDIFHQIANSNDSNDSNDPIKFVNANVSNPLLYDQLDAFLQLDVSNMID